MATERCNQQETCCESDIDEGYKPESICLMHELAPVEFVVIRTGGIARDIGNGVKTFALAANCLCYTELYFTDVLPHTWPAPISILR